MEMPKKFFQKVDLERLLSFIPTQGYGDLSFDKRQQAFEYYKDNGPMFNGPAVIASDGTDEYIVQGTHRSMAGIESILENYADADELLIAVIDSQQDLDYLNHILRNPEMAPPSYRGIPINWNYDSPDQFPVHLNRGFRKFMHEIENNALSMCIEEYIQEYRDAEDNSAPYY